MLGFAATSMVIAGSVIPDASEPHKVLAVGEIFALSAVLLGGGAVLYHAGKRGATAAGITSGEQHKAEYSNLQ